VCLFFPSSVQRVHESDTRDTCDREGENIETLGNFSHDIAAQALVQRRDCWRSEHDSFAQDDVIDVRVL